MPSKVRVLVELDRRQYTGRTAIRQIWAWIDQTTSARRAALLVHGNTGLTSWQKTIELFKIAPCPRKRIWVFREPYHTKPKQSRYIQATSGSGVGRRLPRRGQRIEIDAEMGLEEQGLFFDDEGRLARRSTLPPPSGRIRFTRMQAEIASLAQEQARVNVPIAATGVVNAGNWGTWAGLTATTPQPVAAQQPRRVVRSIDGNWNDPPLEGEDQ